MNNFSRFTVSIQLYCDSIDAVSLNKTLYDTLSAIPRTTIKTLNLDEWADGYSGKIRKFNSNGQEIYESSSDLNNPGNTLMSLTDEEIQLIQAKRDNDSINAKQ